MNKAKRGSVAIRGLSDLFIYRNFEVQIIRVKMKIHKVIVSIVASCVIAAGATSCSVLESLSTKLPGQANVSASKDGVNADVKTESAEKLEKERKKAEERDRKAAAKKAAKEKKEAEKKAREQRKKNAKKGNATATTTPKPADNVTVTNGTKPDFTTGTWHLRSINGYTLSADTDGDDGERPYLIFEDATGRFYGNDGCNTVNGSFTASEGDSLRFGEMLSTLRMCPDAKYAHEFLTALDQTRTCGISGDKAENILELRNEKGKVLMTLAKPAMEFLSGSWQVIRIDGHNVDSPDLKLVIDLPERRIHGNTGCNVLNGEIFIDPDKAGAIQFQQIAVTMAMCPDAKWETPLLVALESVETVSQPEGNATTVDLLDTHGKSVLTLRPLPLNDR